MLSRPRRKVFLEPTLMHAAKLGESQRIDLSVAKHLEPLTKGKFPVEILVRGKDAAANEKQFTNITETIKSAGVSTVFSCLSSVSTNPTLPTEKGRHTHQGHVQRPFRRRMEEDI